jgi:outer membrane protein assembly factor BamB
VPDFAFIHVSDTHLDPRPSGHQYNPEGRSVQALSWFARRSRRRIAADGSLRRPQQKDDTGLPPAFAIHTGDVFEYSIVDDCWADWDRAIEGIACPVHCVPGNHDNTWASINQHLRRRYGSDSYSFDHAGCHFVCLNTAGTLDPLPCWDERTLRWLADDLAQVSHDTPVFLAFHHPQSADAGFASEYDKLRFWDVIRHHHVVLMMDGHWHQVRAGRWQNIPRVNGGETFRVNTGYSTVRVTDGVLHQRYHFHRTAQGGRRQVNLVTHRINQPLPRLSCDLACELRNGGKQLALSGPVFSQQLDDTSQVRATAWIDDQRNAAVALKLADKMLAGTLDLGLAVSGRHYVTVRLELPDRPLAVDSDVAERPTPVANELAVAFEVPDPRGDIAVARHQNGAGIKTPLLLVPRAGQSLLVFGDTAGNVTALDAQSMSPAWQYPTKSEIVHALSVAGDNVLVGDSDGRLHALDSHTGELVYQTDFPAPIFAPGIAVEETFYIGDANGTLHAVNVSDGTVHWSRDVAEYGIEAAPIYDPHHDRILLGAWDGYFYAVNRSTGAVAWKAWNTFGQVKQKSRYYGPADCSPVVVDDIMWGVDRGYALGRYQLADGTFLGQVSENVSAAVAIPGNPTPGVLARGLNHRLTRFDADGQVVWQTDVPLGRSPQTPTYFKSDTLGEVTERVGVVSDIGLFTLVDFATGGVLHRYAVTPSLFVQTPASTADGGAWYAAGMDGVVTRVGVG